MSGNLVTIEEANEWVNHCESLGGEDLVAAKALRKVVAQSEQIYRLQRSLSLTVIHSGSNALAQFEHLYNRGDLLPEDMDFQGGKSG